MKTFIISDTHFSHSNILTFKREDGTILRDFNHINEHDETLIQNWNKVVSPNDKVYHLGDVGFKNWTSLSNILVRLNGTKVLIKGNHDYHKPSQYLQHFKDIRASHVMDKMVLTHIPIHPDSLSRWRANIHGHTHYRNMSDPRYFNTSVEAIHYTPIDFEYIRSVYKE